MNYDFNQLRILVLDDNTYMCRIVQTILSSFGAKHVSVVTDGVRAMELLRAQDFDLAIIDHLMTPVNGLEFARSIRTQKDSPNPDLPILMMTAYTERHRIEAAKVSGVNTLLVKPFTPAELYRRVVYALTTPVEKMSAPDTEQEDAVDDNATVYV